MGQAEGRAKSFCTLFSVVFFSFITEMSMIDNPTSENMYQIVLCVSFRATIRSRIL